MSTRAPVLFIAVVVLAVLAFFYGRLIGYPIEDWAPVIKALVEVIAIAMGGIWTYLIFIRDRFEFPFAKLEHRISNWSIDRNKVYLSLIVIVTNSGKTPINLKQSTVFVRQIEPLDGKLRKLIQNSSVKDLREGLTRELFVDGGRQIRWPEVGFREIKWNEGEVCIEAGEAEELQYDFVLDSESDVVEIISYFEDFLDREPRIGWKLTSLYDLRSKNGKRK